MNASQIPTAMVGAFAFFTLVLPLAALVPARSGGPVLVVGDPWAEGDAAITVIARSEGAIVRMSILPFIAVARSDDPDFHAQLHRAGAWMTLDASWALGCRPEPTFKDDSRA